MCVCVYERECVCEGERKNKRYACVNVCRCQRGIKLERERVREGRKRESEIDRER